MSCPAPLITVSPTVVLLQGRKLTHQYNPSKTIKVNRVVGGGKELFWDIPAIDLPDWLKIIKGHHVGEGSGRFRVMALIDKVPAGFEGGTTVEIKSNALNKASVHVHLSVEE